MTELLILAALGLHVLKGVLMQRALQRLSSEDKLKLLDTVSRERIPASLPVLALIVLFFVGLRWAPGRAILFFVLLTAALVGYSLVLSVLGARSLRVIGVPRAFSRAFALDRVIHFATIGLIFLICCKFLRLI